MNRPILSSEHEALRHQVERMDDKIDRVLDVLARVQEEQSAAAVTRAENRATLDKLTEDVAATKEIVTAWSAVKTWGKFLTWAGGILIVLFGLVSAWKGIPK
jgi:hypothetical protein